ncbi:hypothetical protein FDECE_4876 [Fusarium decemcellulare]|nr:hypothetical protein FDECE_4876 [Fusarium decemcellulare]
MSGLSSDAAWSAIEREKDGSNSYDLTSDTAAENLQDQIRDRTGSLGADAARVIAVHAPKLLILAGRSEQSLQDTIATVKKSCSSTVPIKSLMVDLGSQSSVRAAASELLKLTSVVDVLVNSAGLMMIPVFTKTPEGIEMHFGVNHIGHFLLTNLIMPVLLKSPSPRVVNVSSAAHRSSPVRFDDYNFEDGKTYEPFLGYAQSKCANLLFTVSLSQKLGSKGLVAFGVDPGGSITNLFYRIPTDLLVKHGWADEDDIDDSTPDHAKNPDLAEKLWKLSEKLVGQQFTYI